MFLQSIEFVQFENEPEEWRLHDFTLGPVNLLVGKNATGKSRTLNVINDLAGLVCGESKELFRSGALSVTFSDDSDTLEYCLELRGAKVVSESFALGGTKLLDRKEDGIGKVFAKKEGREIDFQTPVTELAVVARRDSIQHPFFERLHKWGKSVRYYPFGTSLGKKSFAVIREDSREELNTKDSKQVVAIFDKGQRLRGDGFENAVREDMGRIGYPIGKVGLASPRSVIFTGPVGGDAVGLFVQEDELSGKTEQHDMSQGMFRALSIIIQVNYSYLAEEPSCILIDDIGEGLDFQRSTALIELLVDKAKKAGVQLVMATNDRFVMNNVPLEMWSVLQREGGDCRVYNYQNSKAVFDEFKFTGLNNFDFLAADFLNAESVPDA